MPRLCQTAEKVVVREGYVDTICSWCPRNGPPKHGKKIGVYLGNWNSEEKFRLSAVLHKLL